MAATRTCRVCGCTDVQACPGGCSWVAADLCSACEPATAARHATIRRKLLSGVEYLGFALTEIAEAANHPGLLDHAQPIWSDMLLEDAILSLLSAVECAIGAAETNETSPDRDALLAAIAAYRGELSGLLYPDTPEAGAPGASAVNHLHRRHGEDFDMSLKPTAFAHIGLILGALVNGGGVRPEDLDDVTASLAALKAEEDGEATTLADHEKRITALEDGIDATSDALDTAGKSDAGDQSGSGEGTGDQSGAGDQTGSGEGTGDQSSAGDSTGAGESTGGDQSGTGDQSGSGESTGGDQSGTGDQSGSGEGTGDQSGAGDGTGDQTGAA